MSSRGFLFVSHSVSQVAEALQREKCKDRLAKQAVKNIRNVCAICIPVRSSTEFLVLVRRAISYYRFNTDWSIRMLKIASLGLAGKRAKSLGTLETSDFRGFLSIRG